MWNAIGNSRHRQEVAEATHSPERYGNLQNHEEKDNETSASPVEKHVEGCPGHLDSFSYKLLFFSFSVSKPPSSYKNCRNKQN